MATWARTWAIVAAVVFFLLGSFAVSIAVSDIQWIIVICCYGFVALIAAISLYGEALLDRVAIAGVATPSAGSAVMTARDEISKENPPDPDRTVDELWKNADGTYVVLLKSGAAIAFLDKAYRTFDSMASWRALTKNERAILQGVNAEQAQEFFATIGAEYGLAPAK